jgi:hypothetical protein
MSEFKHIKQKIEELKENKEYDIISEFEFNDI